MKYAENTRVFVCLQREVKGFALFLSRLYIRIGAYTRVWRVSHSYSVETEREREREPPYDSWGRAFVLTPCMLTGEITGFSNINFPAGGDPAEARFVNRVFDSCWKG